MDALRKSAMAATRKRRKPKDPPEGGERPRGREASLDSLNVYIRDIAKFKPLSADEEKELGRRIREGDQEAVDRLVEANLRFVVHYAKRYRGLGLSYMDLIHEGSLGLIEAAKRFDPDRNVKFISYAVWWVRQAIFHALSEHARVFRLPQKLSGQVSRLATAREKLKPELERAPTTEELSERTAVLEGGGRAAPARGRGRRVALDRGRRGRQPRARRHPRAGHASPPSRWR